MSETPIYTNACKPCPFCGTPLPRGVIAEQEGKKDVCRILCSTCLALGPAAVLPEEAVDLWNDRLNAEAERSSELLKPPPEDGSSSMRS